MLPFCLSFLSSHTNLSCFLQLPGSPADRRPRTPACPLLGRRLQLPPLPGRPDPTALPFPHFNPCFRPLHLPLPSGPWNSRCPEALTSSLPFPHFLLRRSLDLPLPSSPDPLPACFWAAGFSFSRCSVLHDAPYCPLLRHLFFGEEIYQLARLWTRGYDVFAPSKVVAFHQWERGAREHSYQGDKRVGAAGGGRGLLLQECWDIG